MSAVAGETRRNQKTPGEVRVKGQVSAVKTTRVERSSPVFFQCSRQTGVAL